jgi:hypothetical protein
MPLLPMCVLARYQVRFFLPAANYIAPEMRRQKTKQPRQIAPARLLR